MLKLTYSIFVGAVTNWLLLKNISYKVKHDHVTFVMFVSCVKKFTIARGTLFTKG